MKKTVLTIAFLAVVSAATVFAGTSHKVVSPEMRLDYSIRQQVAVPALISEAPGMHTAEVHFMVNPDGTLKVGQIISDEQGLTENLLNQMGGFKVNTNGLDLNSTYKVVLKFNVQ